MLYCHHVTFYINTKIYRVLNFAKVKQNWNIPVSYSEKPAHGHAADTATVSNNAEPLSV